VDLKNPVRICEDCRKQEVCRCDIVCRYCGGEFILVELEDWRKEING